MLHIILIRKRQRRH